MKQQIKLSFCFIFFIVVFWGCTSVSNLKIEKSEISGPIAQLPVNIVRHADTSVIDLSVGVGYNLNKQKVIEDNYNIENSVWSIHQFIIDAYIDVKLRHGLALFAGFDYAHSQDRILTGGIIGMGHFDTISNFATRFDGGIKFNSMHRKANFTYLVNDSRGYSHWEFDSTISDNSTMDLFVSFTLNTTRKDWKFNPFLRIAYIHQNIISLSVGPPLYSDDVSLNINNLILSTGTSIEVFKKMYIVTGINFNLVYLPNYVKPFSNFMPFLRISYEFESSKIVK